MKEAVLVDGQGQGEHVLSLVNTPQGLLAEGLAETGLDAVLGRAWGPWTAEILGELGLRVDRERMQPVMAQMRRLFPARQDAAILLHDRGADADEAVAYLRRWLLIEDGRARHMVRFLLDPLWRAYVTTYIEGARLVSAWLAGDRADGARADGPEGKPGAGVTERFGRLLREPLLPPTR
ncbi:hypothetical protein ABZ801_23850 [Actinomadura sp. NPDC047616]|uniref:hypothetical protein n=1 Tax=Actinomadura sp. NPDC047616 TaxID=3155914 RepID=UPI0033EEEF38